MHNNDILFNFLKTLSHFLFFQRDFHRFRNSQIYFILCKIIFQKEMSIPGFMQFFKHCNNTFLLIGQFRILDIIRIHTQFNHNANTFQDICTITLQRHSDILDINRLTQNCIKVHICDQIINHRPLIDIYHIALPGIIQLVNKSGDRCQFPLKEISTILITKPVCQRL